MRRVLIVEGDVCLRGCGYSTISSALLAANSGDVVHIHNGAYANEPLNIDVYSNITIRCTPVPHKSLFCSVTRVKLVSLYAPGLTVRLL
jgi:hypothetical protein